MQKRLLKLYWVETVDHDEDWFVVARDRRQAAKIHEQEQDYEPGEAKATLIGTLPHALQEKGDALLGRASDRTLQCCGAKLLNNTLEGGALMGLFDSRVVEIGGQVFKEGNTFANSDRRQNTQLQN